MCVPEVGNSQGTILNPVRFFFNDSMRLYWQGKIYTNGYCKSDPRLSIGRPVLLVYMNKNFDVVF